MWRAYVACWTSAVRAITALANALGPRPQRASTELKADFSASGKVYDSRRVCAVLRARGLRLGRHWAGRLMREHRLRALWRHGSIHTTDSGRSLPVCDNLLARRFDLGGPQSGLGV